MTALPVPSPDVTAETGEFWEALKQGKFLLRRCNDCQSVVWYPRGFCPICGSFSLSWFEGAGTGNIYTFTVVHRSILPDWAATGPYVIAYVELDEGPRIMTNIVNADPETLTIGAPVRVVFPTNDDGEALYRFEPINPINPS
jgi:uncharacterized OB-fold protein